MTSCGQVSELHSVLWVRPPCPSPLARPCWSCHTFLTYSFPSSPRKRHKQLGRTWAFLRDQKSENTRFTLRHEQGFLFFESLFYDALSVTRPYSVDNMVKSEWWWIDEEKRPCLKRDSNPRSQRPCDQGLLLRLRPPGHWDRQFPVNPDNFTVEINLSFFNWNTMFRRLDTASVIGSCLRNVVFSI
jgi:hypothetical protein